MDFKDGKPIWYVRIAPLETPRFRHGLSLGTPFEVEGFVKPDKLELTPENDKAIRETEKKAEEFREAVWQYLKEAFKL